jgi:hypothetical protein
MCVTAEGDAGDVLTTTAGDGTYTLTVAPGDYLVRFDDCGTGDYDQQYWNDAFDRDSATTVTVGDGEPVNGKDGHLTPIAHDSDGAPDTTIDSLPHGTTSSANVSFEFSSDDAEANFECSLDGGAFEPCTSPQGYSELGDGPHHFEVRAIDFFGNRDPSPAGEDFTVDSPAPDGVITAGPSSETIHERTVSFEFTSDDPNAHYICKLDGDSSPCTSPQGYGSPPDRPLADGPHTFELIAVSQGNDGDKTPAIRTFHVSVDGPEDLDPPDTTISDGPADLISTSGAAFSFESDEVDSTFECQLDAGAWEACQSPHVATGLGNGSHEFAVRATDAAGNLDTTPATRSFTVDTTADSTAPDTVIDSGPPDTSTINQTFATFGFSATEAGSTFECSLDGAAFTRCTSPRTFTGLADGQHTFQVRALDAIPNRDTTPAEATFTVDSSGEPDVTAPDTTIDAGPDGPIAVRSATFAFSSTEAGSSFECRLDGGSWVRCTPERTYSPLTEGDHTFEVRATDTAGNRDSSPDSRSFSVDTAPPETNITDGPDGITINTSSTEYEFSSPDSGATFECRLDTADWADCTSPHPLTGLTTGTHTFAVRATDAVGNVDGTPAVRAFTVDVTPPETTIEGSGPSGTVKQVSPIAFTADEPAFFNCRLDGGDWELCSSPHDLGTLTDGSHTFEVQATDSAGNPDPSPATRTFTIDSVAPETTIDRGPTGTTGSTSASFDFSSEAGASFECQMDSGAWSSCTSPQAYSGLGNGSHTFRVRASDAVGNQDASPATRSFTVDTVAPDTTIGSGPAGPTNSASASFGFSASESGSSFQCQIDAEAWGPCSSPQAYSCLSEGDHTFRVRATDAVGNQDPSPASRAFTVDTVAPDATIDSGPSGTIATASAGFTFSSTDSGAAFQCRMDATAWASCASPKGYTGLSEGSHTFRVRAVDAAGNQSAPAERTFAVDLPAPPPPPPPTTDPECSAAKSKLVKAQSALKKAKKKAKKAKSKPARKKAKKKVKKAKKNVRKAKSSVASAC